MVKKNKQAQCPECGRVFKTTQGLSGHLRLKHGRRVLTKARVLSKPLPVLMSAEKAKYLNYEKPCTCEFCGVHLKGFIAEAYHFSHAHPVEWRNHVERMSKSLRGQ